MFDKQVEALATNGKNMNLEIPDLDKIDEFFNFEGTVQEVFDRLKASDSEWAKEHLKILESKDALAVALAYNLLKQGQHLALPQCIRLEKEVTGALVHKGKVSYRFTTPKKYESVYDIPPTDISWHFTRKLQLGA